MAAEKFALHVTSTAGVSSPSDRRAVRCALRLLRRFFPLLGEAVRSETAEIRATLLPFAGFAVPPTHSRGDGGVGAASRRLCLVACGLDPALGNDLGFAAGEMERAQSERVAGDLYEKVGVRAGIERRATESRGFASSWGSG